MAGVATGLRMGGFYAFRVAALLASGPAEPSGYTAPQLIQITGPGRVTLLEVDTVEAHSLHLSWRPPIRDPLGGTWHDDGGSPLIGYRVLVREVAEPHAAARLIASTREIQISLTDLPPQVPSLLSPVPSHPSQALCMPHAHLHSPAS